MRSSKLPVITDPLTENPVVRLTPPSFNCVLPDPWRRSVSSHDFLICASDAAGTWSPHRLDLLNGDLRLIAATRDLDPSSLAMDAQERSVYFLSGGDLCEVSLASRRVRTIAAHVSDFAIGNRTLILRDGKAMDLNGTVFAEGITRLYSPSLLLRGDGLVSLNVGKPLLEGNISEAFWFEGPSVLFLRDQQIGVLANGREAAIARNSRFGCFSPNRNASMLAASTMSHAQPAITLVHVATGSELTLCEHRSSDPTKVNPVFTPDSRRVIFNSDHRTGKQVIFACGVEPFVEKTE